MPKQIPLCDAPGVYLACGLPEGSVLPKPFEDKYWPARRLLSRLGNCGPMPASMIATVALLSGIVEEQPCDLEIETFASLVASGRVKKNDRIRVEWRGEKCEATFIRIKGDGGVEFQLDNEKRSRSVPPDKAGLLEAVA